MTLEQVFPRRRIGLRASASNRLGISSNALKIRDFTAILHSNRPLGKRMRLLAALPTTILPTLIVTGFVSVCSHNRTVRGAEPSNAKPVFESVELNHLSLNLEKIERAETFYRTVFGMTPVSHGRRGNDRFLHFQQGFLNMRPSDESSINHYCVSIEKYEPNVVFQLAEVIETEPYFMGRSVHCFDPDRFNVQIEEAKHGWGRIGGDQLTDADRGLFRTVRIHHLSFNVTDLPESQSFYQEVFGAVDVSCTDQRALLKIGPNSFLELLKSDRAGLNHYCFAVADFDEKSAADKLDGSVHGDITSPEKGVLRFTDPNGIPVEITSTDHAMQ